MSDARNKRLKEIAIASGVGFGIGLITFALIVGQREGVFESLFKIFTKPNPLLFIFGATTVIFSVIVRRIARNRTWSRTKVTIALAIAAFACWLIALIAPLLVIILFVVELNWNSEYAEGMGIAVMFLTPPFVAMEIAILITFGRFEEVEI